MFTTFDRYLLRRYLHAFLILWFSTYGLFVVIDGFTNVDGFQQGRQTAVEVMQTMSLYYVYQSFEFFDQVASVLSVIAVMVVFALLARNSEFHPLLAAGVPTHRLLLPVMVGTMLVNLIVLANQELVIPGIGVHLQASRSKKGTSGIPVEPLYDRKTRILIRGKGLHFSERRLEQAEFLLPAPELANDITPLKARNAIYFHETDKRPSGWLLRDYSPAYSQLQLTDNGRKYVRRTKKANEIFVVTDVNYEQLHNRAQNFRYLSTPQLLRRIQNPSTGLISVRSQMLFFHKRLVRPLISLIAVIIVVPLILRRESRSLVANMAVCALVMGMLYGVTFLFGYLGQANIIAPDLAAWSPVIFCGSFSVWIFGFAQA